MPNGGMRIPDHEAIQETLQLRRCLQDCLRLIPAHLVKLLSEETRLWAIKDSRRRIEQAAREAARTQEENIREQAASKLTDTDGTERDED